MRSLSLRSPTLRICLWTTLFLVSGSNCSESRGPCAQRPCENGGQCRETDDDYDCLCESGFSGNNCETDIDDCAADPCQNGADCIDGVNSYACACGGGYSGINCQTDTDECLFNSCQNGADCIDGVNGYTCDCPEGYSGETCDLEPATGARTIKICDSPNILLDSNHTRTPKAMWASTLKPNDPTNPKSNRIYVGWDPTPDANVYKFIQTLHSACPPNNPCYVEDDYGTSFNAGFEYSADYEWAQWYVELNPVSFSKYLSDQHKVTLNVSAFSRDADGDDTLLYEYPPFLFTMAEEYVEGTPVVWGENGDEEVTLSWCKMDNVESYELTYGMAISSLTTSSAQKTTIAANKNSGLNTFTHTIGGLTNGQPYYFALTPIGKYARGISGDALRLTPDEDLVPLDVGIDAVTLNQATEANLDPDAAESIVRVAGKPGVLRIFLTLGGAVNGRKAVVQLNGTYQGEPLTPMKNTFVIFDSPLQNAESTNFPVTFELSDPEWLRPGTTFSVEVDPADLFDETDEGNNRYPRSGETSFGFESTPPLKLKLIRTRSTHGLSRELSDDLIDAIRTGFLDMYPISEIHIETVDTVLDLTPYNVNQDMSGPLAMVRSFRQTDVGNGTSHYVYYALVKQDPDSAGGVAGLAPKNSLEEWDSLELYGIGNDNENDLLSIILHELGHVHGMGHVQGKDEYNDLCLESGNNELTYPYNQSDDDGMEYGRIGKTGYIASQKKLVSKTYYHDIMTYCLFRTWISDFTFNKLHSFYDHYGAESNLASVRQSPPLSRDMPNIRGTRLQGQLVGKKWEFHSVSHTMALPRTSDQAGAYRMRVITEDGTHLAPVNMTELDHSDTLFFEVFIADQSPVLSVAINDPGGREVFRLEENSTRHSAIDEGHLEHLGGDLWKLAAIPPVNQRVVRLYRAATNSWSILSLDHGDRELTFQATREDLLDIGWNEGLQVFHFSVELENFE